MAEGPGLPQARPKHHEGTGHSLSPPSTSPTLALHHTQHNQLLATPQQCLYQHAAKRPSFDEIVPALESWKPKVSHVAKATGGDSLDALLST